MAAPECDLCPAPRQHQWKQLDCHHLASHPSPCPSRFRRWRLPVRHLRKMLPRIPPFPHLSLPKYPFDISLEAQWGRSVNLFGLSAHHCWVPSLVTAGAHVQATGALRRFPTGAKLAAILQIVVPTNLTCSHPGGIVSKLLWATPLSSGLSLSTVVLWSWSRCRLHCRLWFISSICDTLAWR